MYDAPTFDAWLSSPAPDLSFLEGLDAEDEPPARPVASTRPSPLLGGLRAHRSGWLPACATLWRPAKVPPLSVARDLPPGLALSQLVVSMAAEARFGTSEPVTVMPGTLLDESLLDGGVYFYNDVPAMRLLSRMIEQRVLTTRLECELHVGFQRLALLRPQTQRYLALLEAARYVCVYGLPDDTDDEGTGELWHRRLLRFPLDPATDTGLESLWFVVVEHPNWRTALVAQQIGGKPGLPGRGKRRYAGFWTSDPQVTEQVLTVLRETGRRLYYGAN